MILTGNRFAPTMRPAGAAPGCALTAAMVLWDRHVVQPLARKSFGLKVVELATLRRYNCLKIPSPQSPCLHSTATALALSPFPFFFSSFLSCLFLFFFFSFFSLFF